MKYRNMVNGFKVSVAEDGMRGLARGWAPTFIGYSMQGLCKFGLYEVFKNFYSDLLGEVSNLLLHVIKIILYRQPHIYAIEVNYINRKKPTCTVPACTWQHQPVQSFLLTLLYVQWSQLKSDCKLLKDGELHSESVHQRCGKQKE